MTKKPFEQWLFEEVEIAFGLERFYEYENLDKWLQTSQKVPKLPTAIEEMRQMLNKNVELWNEDELKMLFIAPFLLEFKFYNLPHYRVFTQRSFTLKTDEVEASGRVEWFVATGKQTPKKPFFFLQEYKPEKNSGNDPLGQLLIAMVNAQNLNQDANKPLYGSYTIGRLWFFVILEDKNYAVSRAYDATQEDALTAMVVILQRVKNFIHQELNLPLEKF